VFAPLEVGYQRERLVNKEKFLTGQAAGLSNGVNFPRRFKIPQSILIAIHLAFLRKAIPEKYPAF
jgi:hypothetical protein